MRIYHRLIHIRDQKERHEEIPDEIASHPVFLLTTRFRLHIQTRSAPITKTSRLIVDAEGMQIFADLAAVLRTQNNVVMIYLVACIMERLFGKDTIEDIELIRGDLTLPEIIDGVSRPAVEDSQTPSGTELINGAPLGRPVSAVADLIGATRKPAATRSAIGMHARPSDSAPQTSTGQVQSAFSTLVPSNTFTKVTSAFGGNVFGPVFPSPSPQSVFGPSSFPSSISPSTTSSAPVTPPSAPLVSSSAKIPPSIFGHPATNPPPNSAETSVADDLPAASSAYVSSNADIRLSVAGKDSLSSPIPEPPSAALAEEPTSRTTLNPAAPAFVSTGLFSPDTKSSPSFTRLQGSTAPLIVVPTVSQIPTNSVSHSPGSTLPTIASSPSPSQHSRVTSSQTKEPRIVERRQTLWDLPSTTPASLANIPSVNSHHTAGAPPSWSPTNPPLLNKPSPLALPPTPTARWFDPSSYPETLTKANGTSLSLRKQSLGLSALQVPEAVSSAEILSPLSLSTPKTAAPYTADNASPTTLPRSSEPTASTSHLLVEHSRSLADITGRQGHSDVDLKTVATEFSRRGLAVRACFRLWKKRTIDRAAWAEACLRSDVYQEKMQRHRLSSSTSSLPDRLPHSNLKKRRISANAAPVSASHGRYRKRTSDQYKPPVNDDTLTKRLKEVGLLEFLHCHTHELSICRITKSINGVGPEDHSCTQYALLSNKHSKKTRCLRSGAFGFP